MLWSIDSCQKRVSADQCHMTASWAQVYNSWKWCNFLKLPTDQLFVFNWSRVQVNFFNGRIQHPSKVSLLALSKSIYWIFDVHLYMGHYVFNSISTDRTPCGSWTHRSGWTNSHQAKQKSWWSRNSASVLEGRRIIFLLQFLSWHRHPQMQSPTLHSVYLRIVSRRTETAWFWMAANIEDKNNSVAVYVGSSLIVHNPFFSSQIVTE